MQRPKTREQGAERISSYVRWLYGKRTAPTTLAEPLLDAAFAQIREIDDEAVQKKLLCEALERAYINLVEA